jgi:hypothetical protein
MIFQFKTREEVQDGAAKRWKGKIVLIEKEIKWIIRNL